MDFKGLILVIIVAIIVWWYSDFATVLVLVLLGLLIALLVFIFTILRSEGKIKAITSWFRKLGKKYKKFETKLFKFWDEL